MERTLEEIVRKVIKTLEEKGIAVKDAGTINIKGKMFTVSVDTSANKETLFETLKDLSRTKVDCVIDGKPDKLLIVFEEAEETEEAEEEITTGTEERVLENILEKLEIPVR